MIADSKEIRDQATRLLVMVGIESELARYGISSLIGSYAYDVMVKPDIDFHVVVEKLDEKLVKNFFEYAVNSGYFEEIIFHDKHKFNEQAAKRYPSKKALDSYYFGLRTEFENVDWQIGINFITRPQEAAVEIGRLFENMGDRQREIILKFKRRMIEIGYKVSSAHIYRAVLEKQITSEKELLDYLKTLGYSFNK